MLFDIFTNREWTPFTPAFVVPVVTLELSSNNNNNDENEYYNINEDDNKNYESDTQICHLHFCPDL